MGLEFRRVLFRSLRESLHQWWSLTAVSTALVVRPVVVNTSMVLAVVLWRRSPPPPTEGPPLEALAKLVWGKGGGWQAVSESKGAGDTHADNIETTTSQGTRTLVQDDAVATSALGRHSFLTG